MNKKTALLFIAAALLAACLAFLPRTAVGAPTCRELKTRHEKEVVRMNLVEQELRKYARFNLSVDTAGLSDNDRKCLLELARAARAIDRLFWKQSSFDGLALKKRLERSKDPVDKKFLRALVLNCGPYLRFEGNLRFCGEGPENKPAGAAFYPPDMTKAEFENYVAAHPEKKAAFEKLNTLIRRKGIGLAAIPFEKAYRAELSAARSALQSAVKYADNPSFRKYLELRLRALTGGDYFESDVAWVRMKDSPLDLIIGPIETYEDQLLGLKGAYEGAVLVRDPEGSRSLEVYLEHLNALQENLPGARGRKSAAAGLGGTSLQVVNVALFTGEFNKNVKTLACSLPNDERVTSDYGAKKLLFKNVMEAKFNQILIPIGKAMLEPKDQSLVSWKAFFNHVLLHEISHTLGVETTLDGRTLRDALRDNYSAIEECKADVLGLFHVPCLAGIRILTAKDEKESAATFLAGLFRSVRFGTGDAHGTGVAIQLNFLLKEGAVTCDPERGTYGLDSEKIPGAIGKLAAKLLEIQSNGDYQGAARLIADYGSLAPREKNNLKKLENIPVDVDLRYPY
jgi:hypothetical protein